MFWQTTGLIVIKQFGIIKLIYYFIDSIRSSGSHTPTSQKPTRTSPVPSRRKTKSAANIALSDDEDDSQIYIRQTYRKNSIFYIF